MADFDAGTASLTTAANALAADRVLVYSPGNTAWEVFSSATFLDAILRLSADGLVPSQVTPSQIAGNQNNYAPGVATTLNLSADAARTITGLVAGVDGELRIIRNVGVAGNKITLAYESGSSTAANRFNTPNGINVVLDSSVNKAGDACLAMYVGGSINRWWLYPLPSAGLWAVSNIILGGNNNVTDDGNSRFWVYDGSTAKIFIRANGIDFASDQYLRWDTTTTCDGTPDVSITRPATKTLAMTGMLNQTGHVRVTADVTNASDTLATITGLSVDLQAGRTYTFLAELPVATGAVLEGVKVSLSGSATITNLIADIEIMSHAATPVFTLGRVTVFDSAIGQTVADAGNATVEIRGTITVNAAGTFLIQGAKNADTGALLTTFKRGGYLWVEDVS